jgi:SNF2 family DNA or RNA helicase
MSPEQKRVYKELERRLIVEYNNHDLSVKNKLSLIGRLQQITGGFFPYTEIDGEEKRTGIEAIQGANPKLIALENDIEETGNEKIIIWARFTAEIKMLEKELKKTFHSEKIVKSYFGETPEKERGRIIEEFKAGKIDVLIINQSAGIGFNFQISTLHYYFSNSYSLEQRKQSEDRSHRSGQKNTVVYKDLIMAGTVDEKVYSVLKNKEDLLDYFRSKTIREFLTEK